MQTSLAVALALIGHYDPLRRDGALTSRKTARQHHAHTLSLLRTVPGIGESLRLVWLYELHDLARFPRGQDVVSDCRLGKCHQEAAGKRDGTAGAKIGTAYLTWACSEAAVLGLRANPAGQKCRTRLEKKEGKGTALTVLAHQLARAVYDIVQRQTACDMDQLLNGEQGAERTRPAPHWTPRGSAEEQGSASMEPRRRCTRRSLAAAFSLLPVP